jgi:carboxyl-terminal processing protease
MRHLLLLLAVISTISCSREQKIIHSNKKPIKVLINRKSTDWTISPEINPDILQVYCSNENNIVIFQTDIDSAVFSVRKNDTIRFGIILNSKDTAITEIIGIKDLPNKISNIEKVYWLGQEWAEIKYNFVNVDKLKFNLDSLYKSFIPLVLNSKNDFEYYKILQKFMASMHDGHSEVYGNFYPYTDYVPVLFKDFNKKVYVVSVLKKPGQDSTWVGAELIEIEGIPTAKYLESNIFPYVSASTDQSLWMQGVYKLHSDLRDHPFRGSIRRRDGTIVKLDIQRNGEATRTPDDKYWGPKVINSGKIIELKWMDNDIALISFNRFEPEAEAIKEFDKVAKELDKAKGVIVDLRHNGGGSTGVAWHLQKYLTKGKQFLNYAWETRINDGAGKANGNWQEEYKNFFLNKAYRFEKPETITVLDTIKRIKCPTVILIGRYTFSAAEDFLVNIYEVPDRPELIGEETAGSTGSPLFIPGLPESGSMRICTRRICYPVSGKPFVNRGVKPDIEIKQTIEDYLNGKDVALDRAILELKKQSNNFSNSTKSISR